MIHTLCKDDCRRYKHYVAFNFETCLHVTCYSLTSIPFVIDNDSI